MTFNIYLEDKFLKEDHMKYFFTQLFNPVPKQLDHLASLGYIKDTFLFLKITLHICSQISWLTFSGTEDMLTF